MKFRSNILLISFSLLYLSAFSQGFSNLSFEQKCDSSKTGLCSWDLSWGGKEAVKPVSNNGRNALLIKGKAQNAVGFVEQSLQQTSSAFIQVLKISADIRADSIVGKGAGLNIGLYDNDGSLISTKDMGGFYSVSWVSGTVDWSNREISIVVPVETATIKVGMILYGSGQAWFSNFTVDLFSIKGRIPSALAQTYLSATIDTVAKHSLVRDSIDKTALLNTAMQIAGNAQSYDDCHLAVHYLLESLRPFGDHHSFFMSADEYKIWESEGSQVEEIVYPSSQLMDDIGYLLIPPFHGGNETLVLDYAKKLQSEIEILDQSSIKGWIVDLRENTGGNMEPMIAGLGPLFSSKKLGALVDVNGVPDSWYYDRGRYYSDTGEGVTISYPVVISTPRPIAVLTSSQTGSSGEIVVISFIRNAMTKSFGQPTWGLTTGNGDFALADGSRVFIASTVMADRNGVEYNGRIEPDVLIDDNPDTDFDDVIEAAKQWILNYK